MEDISASCYIQPDINIVLNIKFQQYGAKSKDYQDQLTGIADRHLTDGNIIFELVKGLPSHYDGIIITDQPVQRCCSITLLACSARGKGFWVIADNPRLITGSAGGSSSSHQCNYRHRKRCTGESGVSNTELLQLYCW